MADIRHDFPISAPRPAVFAAISTAAGLDRWWTSRCSGAAVLGSTFDLGFGVDYQWQAVVRRCEPPSEFELEMTRSDSDWQGTLVGFRLVERDGVTWVQFHHSGWPEVNEHFRTSSFCWALYLRLLGRALERGEVVPYEARLRA